MSAAYLWGGLVDLLGQDAVDAWDCYSLQGRSWCNTDDADQLRMVGGQRSWPHRVKADDEDDFDILVGVTSMLRSRTWDDFFRLKRYLKKDGKVAYVETYDSPEDIFPPDRQEVDAIFKREIDPAVPYRKFYFGRNPLPLLCASYEHWFQHFNHNKTRDVFCVQNALTTGKAHPMRYEVTKRVFMTSRWHDSLVSSSGCLPLDVYLGMLNQYKLCVSCPGGGCSCDQTRMWEAMGFGVIPVLCGHPCRVRWPFFNYGADPGVHDIFYCAVDELPSVIEIALAADLTPMRKRMKAKALRDHTAAARAKQMIDLVMSDGWRYPKGEWAW